jgi:signal transduction histidine kinase
MIGLSDILQGKILIVDDQQSSISLLEKLLRGAGYLSVSSTTRPEEVCELHRQNQYALILLDLHMPGMDGFQVMESLKTLGPDCYLPIVVITAQPEQKLRALKAGAKDFVSKPFDFTEILIRVHNFVEARLLQLAAEKRSEQAEGRFIESQKMDAIGQLASGVAHDFNNILAIVMGYSELAMHKIGPGSPVMKDLEVIRSAAERAAGLTRQLLIFSRKETVNLVVLDLNLVVQDLHKMLHRLLHEDIEMTIIPGKQPGFVKADSGYLGQVLINLAVNARDAMPTGGRLTITVNNVTLDQSHARALPDAVPGDYVELTVTDTGTGMTDEVKAHLFEALFTTKPKGKGTGLGLATCETIVQQCGGHIGVSSQVGQGTSFRIYFPRVTQEPVLPPTSVKNGRMPQGTETLLVVEDDTLVRHLACHVLEAQGYRVLAASNGEDALRVVGEHRGPPIQLVITDVIMPQMGGKAMAEWLKTTYPNLKFLFTSGYTDDAIVHHGVLEAGIAFLPKPYTPATLGRKVRSMLDNEPDTAFLHNTRSATDQSHPTAQIV